MGSLCHRPRELKIPRGSLTSRNRLKKRKIAAQIEKATKNKKGHFLMPFARSMIRVTKKVHTKNPAFSTKRPKRRRIAINRAALPVINGVLLGTRFAFSRKEVRIIDRDRPPIIEPARKGKNPGPGLFVFPMPSLVVS
jgi:hypothetical protein